MTERGSFSILNNTETPAEPDVLLFSALDPCVLVAGTYHLEEDGSRRGSLLVYTIDPSTFTLYDVKFSMLTLTVNWHRSSIAILQFWMQIGKTHRYRTHVSRHSLRPHQLVVALSIGCIAIYELSLEDMKAPQLCHIGNFQLFHESALVLSLAVHAISARVLTTVSTGEVSVVDVECGNASASCIWNAHDLEVWCGAWKTPDTVLTGGDDALLKVWDIRRDPQSPQMVCKRSKPFKSFCPDLCSHNAGVVSILPVSEHTFLTGSYDNYLRSFDYRNLRRPISSIDLDGGVWRILPRPNSRSTSLLACCMQSGARVVTMKESHSFERKGLFEPQEDNRLIYGASWQNEGIAALCSFYEKKLYLCRIP